MDKQHFFLIVFFGAGMVLGWSTPTEPGRFTSAFKVCVMIALILFCIYGLIAVDLA